MAKKAEHILELDLPSKTYFWLLTLKDGKDENGKELTGYNLAKHVYKEHFYSPVKIYAMIKELEEKGLIKIEETIIKGKKAKIIRPNLLEFVKVLNERRMPEEYRLNEEEVKFLAKWFEEIDLRKVFSIKEEMEKKALFDATLHETGNLNVLEGISMILKTGVFYSEKIRKTNKKLLQKLSTKTTPETKETIEMLKWFDKLPENIVEKLKHITAHPLLDILLSFSELSGFTIQQFIDSLKNKG